jgi:hypothetical protein
MENAHPELPAVLAALCIRASSGMERRSRKAQAANGFSGEHSTGDKKFLLGRI